MFVSAGEAGDAKKVQTSVAAARKVFRIFRVSTCLALMKIALTNLGDSLFLTAALGSSFTCSAEPHTQPQEACAPRAHQQGKISLL